MPLARQFLILALDLWIAACRRSLFAFCRPCAELLWFGLHHGSPDGGMSFNTKDNDRFLAKRAAAKLKEQQLTWKRASTPRSIGTVAAGDFCDSQGFLTTPCRSARTPHLLVSSLLIRVLRGISKCRECAIPLGETRADLFFTIG